MSEKEKSDTYLFRLVHMTIFHIAKNKLRIRFLENLLKEKNVLISEELEKKWDAYLKKDLPEIFEEIEQDIGFENIKLEFRKDGSLYISGLPERENT